MAAARAGWAAAPGIVASPRRGPGAGGRELGAPIGHSARASVPAGGSSAIASLAFCAAGRSARGRRRGRAGSSVWEVVARHTSAPHARCARREGDARDEVRALRGDAPPDTRVGVLLQNIGTPRSTSVEDVRDYLSRFLGDDRVIDIEPKWLKFIVLQLLLGTRPAKSAANYRRIWDPDRGSPLQFHTEDLVAGLQQSLGDDYVVRIGFQYSEPFTADAVKQFAEDGVNQIILVPMFPQYASGTTGTCLAVAYKQAAEMLFTPFFRIVPPFFADDAFLSAVERQIAEVIGPKGCNVDHMLFSFHGLPVAQCTAAHRDGKQCDCQVTGRLTSANQNCYRAQCHDTARRLAARLRLEAGFWSVGFQSRLTLRGTVKWIEPYSDEIWVGLAEKGVKRLAVVAPSFTADCIETLEELGISGQEEFRAAGGEELVVIPCVNSSEKWVSGLADLVRRPNAICAGAVAVEEKERNNRPASDELGTWSREKIAEVESVA